MTDARLHDLVRHQRSDLHEAGLITDDEFVALAGDHAAVARLEGYDAMRERIADYRRDNDALDKENDDLRTRAESAERERDEALRGLAALTMGVRELESFALRTLPGAGVASRIRMLMTGSPDAALTHLLAEAEERGRVAMRGEAKDNYRAGLIDVAEFLEQRAGEIEAGGGLTAATMGRIFRGEAQTIRTVLATHGRTTTPTPDPKP